MRKLFKLNGTNHGDDITDAVFGTVFDKKLLAEMTWTGKTAQKGVKKISLKKYSAILNLTSGLAMEGSKSYSKNECEKHITYNVLKYAYRSKSGNAKKTAVVDPKQTESSNEMMAPKAAPETAQSTSQASAIHESQEKPIMPTCTTTTPSSIRHQYAPPPFYGSYNNQLYYPNYNQPYYQGL